MESEDFGSYLRNKVANMEPDHLDFFYLCMGSDIKVSAIWLNVLRDKQTVSNITNQTTYIMKVHESSDVSELVRLEYSLAIQITMLGEMISRKIRENPSLYPPSYSSILYVHDNLLDEIKLHLESVAKEAGDVFRLYKELDGEGG